MLGLPCTSSPARSGTEEEIREFCSLNYGVTFPLGSKLDVNGPSRHPLYRLLAGEGAPGDITWNFEKFLVGRDGRVLARRPRTTPDDPSLMSRPSRRRLADCLASSLICAQMRQCLAVSSVPLVDLIVALLNRLTCRGASR